MPEPSPSGERQWSSSSLKGTQQSIIKPALTVRNIVATTARVMMKAARAMGAALAVAVATGGGGGKGEGKGEGKGGVDWWW